MLQSVLESSQAKLRYSRVVSFVCIPFKDHLDDCLSVSCLCDYICYILSIL